MLNLKWKEILNDDRNSRKEEAKDLQILNFLFIFHPIFFFFTLLLFNQLRKSVFLLCFLFFSLPKSMNQTEPKHHQQGAPSISHHVKVSVHLNLYSWFTLNACLVSYWIFLSGFRLLDTWEAGHNQLDILVSIILFNLCLPMCIQILKM